MSKQVNLNIGMIVCFQCSDIAAVRKNKNGLLYFDCLNCGRITPNLPGGQAYILDRAKLWGAAGPPADCPRWIAEQWPWGKSMRDPAGVQPVSSKPINRETPKPAPKAAPVADLPPEPPEKPEAAPVHTPKRDSKPDIWENW